MLLVGAGLGLLGHRQEVEDPAAAVVDAEDRQLGSGAASSDEPADVVQQGELADHQVDRFARCDSGARGARDDTVDAVGAAVTEDADVAIGAREVGLEVADRQR